MMAAGACGQESTGDNPLRDEQTAPGQNGGESQQVDLVETEARLAGRYNRLELLVSRLAELSRSTQPRRARLLRELIAQSRDRDIAGRFQGIVDALREESLASAHEGQLELQAELQKLLELLLREDRERQIESQRKRIRKYLGDIKRLIRLQRGVKARTTGGDETPRLAKDQQSIAEAAGKLQKQIEANEGSAKPKENKSNGKPQDVGKPSNGQPPSGQGQSQPSQDGQAEGSGGKPSNAAESGAQPGQDKPPTAPMERAQQRIHKAQQRMQEAQKKLQQAKRKGATDRQEQALRELEQAKAELERILRQLREEELERTLVMLEARFRKMLDMQVAVYEETKQLDRGKSNAPEHEVEIASGRLSRKERQIVREAERALILLREDGSSVAFPEAVEQAREDMQETADRLSEVKLGAITQGLEEDIIAALEEILAALQQALKDLRDRKGKPGKPSSPGEDVLVDQLAELRMIRALQQRVNRRTQRYGELIKGDQTLATQLQDAIEKLALREEHIFRATHDLFTKKNQ